MELAALSGLWQRALVLSWEETPEGHCWVVLGNLPPGGSVVELRLGLLDRAQAGAFQQV